MNVAAASIHVVPTGHKSFVCFWSVIGQHDDTRRNEGGKDVEYQALVADFNLLAKISAGNRDCVSFSLH